MENVVTQRVAVRCIVWLDFLHTDCMQKCVQIAQSRFVEKSRSIIIKIISDQDDTDFRVGGIYGEFRNGNKVIS